MGVHQAGSHDLLGRRCRVEPQSLAALTGIPIEAAEDPAFDQNRSMLQRGPWTPQDPNRIQQQSVLHGIRGRPQRCGRSRCRNVK